MRLIPVGEILTWELSPCCVHQKWTKWHIEYPRPRWHITLMYAILTVPTIPRPRLHSSFLQLPSLALRGEKMHSLTRKVCQYFFSYFCSPKKTRLYFAIKCGYTIAVQGILGSFLDFPLKKLHFLGRNYQLIKRIQIK